MASDRKAWEKLLDENIDWETKRRRHCREIEQLCLRGIPPAVRRRAWQAMISNPLEISREQYQITRARALRIAHKQAQRDDELQIRNREMQIKIVANNADETSRLSSESRSMIGLCAPSTASLTESVNSNEFRQSCGTSTLTLSGTKAASMALLNQDIPRTFPQYAFFHDSGALREVLQTFACYRPDVGYIQGMTYLAASLLLYMEDGYEVFVCLANMLSGHLIDFYRFDMTQINVHLKAFEYFFQMRLPMLFNHFALHGVTSDMYCLEWSLTLFVKSLPLDICIRVWDSYLLLGEVFFVRAALGLLCLYAETLRASEMEGILQFLQRLPEDIDADQLFATINEIQISHESFQKHLLDDGASKSICVIT